MTAPSRRRIERLLRYGAMASAGVFLAAVVINLVGICLFRHPVVGFSDNIMEDAQAVATGHLQYGNPATQFVGFQYTPLFTWLVAGLLRLYWWEGWGSVLSVVAALAAIASMVRMLWVSTRQWQGRIVTASFVVALSLGGLSALPVLGLPISALYDARPDQMAWCLLVIAGTLTFGGLLSPGGFSRKQMVVIGLLLTAAVFTKQTTIVTCLVIAGIVLVAPRLIGPGPTWTWRRWLSSATVLVTFAGTSALFGIVLQVVSRGWAYDLLVADPMRYGRWVPLGQEIGTSLRLLIVPLVALVVLVVCVTWSLRANPERDRRRHVVLAVAAVVVAISPIPTAILAESKLGGEANQLAGPVWTLVLGCAVLLMLLRPSGRQLAAAAIAFGVLLAGLDPLAQVMPDHLGAPNLDQVVHWSNMNPFLLAAVDKGEAVFDENYPSLSVSTADPGYPAGDINDILAGGYTPRWFTNNLLTGRYALVAPFVPWGGLPWYDSDVGRYSASVQWEYNLLLHMGYTKVKESEGTVYYRPGPRLKQLGWFAGCIGPYQARSAGVEVRLRGAGGLACIDAEGLHLTVAPVQTTQFVMTLATGQGEVSVHFKTTPHALRVTPLDGHDRAASATSDIVHPGSAVARCLADDGGRDTLTLEAGGSAGGARCHMTQAGPVLAMPVTAGGSTAHVALSIAAANSPTIMATSSSGGSVPFTLLDLTPSDINSL
ncbi:MAG: hypothetical protein ABSC30_11855 [Acidimicrobiales bacterium]